MTEPSDQAAIIDTGYLEKHPHLFRQVMAASGVAMSIRDHTLRPVFANAAFTDFYGYTLGELVDKSLEDIMPETTLALFTETIRPTVLGGSSWEGEYAIRVKGGRLYNVWSRFDPVLDDRGRITHAISIMRDASESMALRNALTHTERHLQFLSENFSDCLFRLRLTDGHYDYISSAVENLTGYTAQEFYETPRFFDLLVPEMWSDKVEQCWNEYRAGLPQQEYEFPVQHKDGRLRWINQRATIVRAESGQPVAAEGIFTDVTDRRRAQEDLADAQKSLRFIAESTSDIFFRLRIPDGRYDYLSPSVERFSGYTVQEYEENPYLIREIVHPDWHDYFDETWEELMRGEVRPEYEFQYVHKSGEVRWARQRSVLHLDDSGRPIALEGIATDATAHKLAEEALKASEEKFRFLAENIADVVWILDSDLRFVSVTPSVQSLWGYAEEEFIGMDVERVFTPESLRQMQAARAVLDERSLDDPDYVDHAEFEHVHRNGSRLWAETLVRRLYNDDGQPVGYHGVSRNITERKLAELAVLDNEYRFRTLFEESPISLWEEDLTRLKAFFDELKGRGVTDFRSHFYDNPEDLGKCATLVDVVDVNKATLDLLRARDRDELLGNLDKVLTESSMAAFTEEMILLASGGCEYCGEITHLTLEGDLIWVVVNFIVPPEYQESLSRVIVSLIDVTPRKRAEQALMESEERYRVLVENAQEGVVVAREGKWLFVNGAMSRLCGYSTQELKDMSARELIHPDDRRIAAELLGSVNGRRAREGFAIFRILTGNRQVKWVALTVKPITWEGEHASLEILTDITMHKLLEDELRQAHGEMEERVQQRTAELSEANLRLTEEVSEREKAQDHILSLTQELIRIQENERQRISRDLHDNVAQDLSSIVLKLETLFDGPGEVDPLFRERGEEIASIVRGTIAEVRGIAYGLRPPALDQLGLVRAMENHCQEVIRRHGLEMDFLAVGIDNLRLDFDAEINIYRMLQEAIGNVVRHAGADKVVVRVVKSHPDLLVRIEDNGTGFDVEQRRAEAVGEQRMGLRSMEERTRIVGGFMEIQSKVGKGTRIVFKVPLKVAGRQ